MSASTRIRSLEKICDREIEGLSGVLIDCVEGGASVSFLLPMTRAKADAFWRSAAESVARGERIVLAAEVPAQWGLEFTAILALIAMTLPMISGKPALIGAVTAGVIAVVAAGLPLKLGLLVAVVAGIAAAMSTEIMLERHANTGGTT